MLTYFFFSIEIVLLSLILFLILFYCFYSNYVTKACDYLNLTSWMLLLFLLVLVPLCLICWEFPIININWNFGLRFDYWVCLVKRILSVSILFYGFFLFINLKSYSFLHIEFILLCIAFLITSCLLISVNDFLMFFLLIDLQSIIFFFLIAYNSTSLKSTEVSWKYFIVNGFASSIMLFGIALIFWITQTISFIELADFVKIWISSQSLTAGYIFNCGFIFFLFGFLIKLGIFPFHYWMLDMFEGTPLIVLPIVAAIGKIAQFSIFFYLIFKLMFSHIIWLILLFFGLLSVVGSAYAILAETKLIRQLALLSVYSGGVILLFLASDHLFGWSFACFYLCLSNFFMLMFFCILSLLRDYTGPITSLNYLSFSNLLKNSKILSFSIVLLVVSLLGLPPLVGFFPKVFLLYILASQFLLAYVLFFLISTLFIIFSFLYILKQIFFSIFDETPFVQTGWIITISRSNAVWLGFGLGFSFWLIFFGSSLFLTTTCVELLTLIWN